MILLKKHPRWVVLGLILIPLITAVICLGVGRYALPWNEALKVLLSAVTNGKTAVDPQSYSVLHIRLSRILLALLCGGGLAVAGAAFQALFNNPLATPDTLGVAAGSAFGAVFAMLFFQGLLMIQFLALIMGLIAVFITYTISKARGKVTLIMMVLAGLMVSSMFQAFVSLVKFTADTENQLPAITYWLMGSLAHVTYSSLLIGSPIILLGTIVIFAVRWKFNVLSLSEDEAWSLGIDVKRTRGIVIAAATLITAATVSLCGQVGWVGLLIPHLTRMLLGSNNVWVIPGSISLGAVFMVIMDTLARSLTAAEIPISILTATLGAPFFIYLLKKTGGGWL